MRNSYADLIKVCNER